MSKRFYSFKPAGPLQKKSGNAFLPWTEECSIPSSVTNGGIKSALTYLKQLHLPNNKFPQIVMKHQLYSVMINRTTVDRGVNQLQEAGNIKLFKTSLGIDQACIMFTTDYINHIKAMYNAESALCSKDILKVLNKFLEEVVPSLRNISIDENILLKKHGFKDADITEMIKIGVLNVKDAGTWWLAIPDVGNFLKVFRKGRQSVLQMIQRTKYKEINYKNLVSRKPPASLKLTIEFHVHDLVGADLVTCVESTTGVLLRLVKD